MTSDKNKALLLDSIAHWERMRDAWPFMSDEEDEPVGSQCALCAVYSRSNPHVSPGTGCVGCPIADDTGLRGCSATPYAASSETFFELYDNLMETPPQHPNDYEEWEDCDAAIMQAELDKPTPFKAQAQAMIDFMKELL